MILLLVIADESVACTMMHKTESRVAHRLSAVVIDHYYRSIGLPVVAHSLRMYGILLQQLITMIQQPAR